MKKPRFNGLMTALIPLILAAILFTLASIPMMTLKYPQEIASDWVCEDPQFSLSFAEYATSDMADREVLIWQGREIRVKILFGQGDFTVYPKYSNDYDDRLFTGTWKIRNGSLILTIDEDLIFGGQYQKLIFHPNTP